MLTRWLSNPEERRHVLRWGMVALVLHFLAGLQTAGWNHLDEHYQILEFANAMLGKTPRSHLAWEYPARLRPALQPAIYAVVAKGLGAVGIENPFTWATVFRVLSALVSWFTTMLLGLAAFRSFGSSPLRRWVFPTLALAWFLPYLHGRTSSENLSEACFVAGTALLWLRFGSIDSRAGNRDLPASLALLVGLLYGLSFEFRFQAGALVAGAGFWCLFVRRLSWKPIALLTVGLLTAIAVGTGVDRWFYGEWAFAPWNYLRVNVFEHKASSFGVSPWYAYIPGLIERGAPPYSLVLIAGVFWTWFTRRWSLLTWSTVPFVLLHMAIAHKEMRFLYPMASIALVMMLQAFDDQRERLGRLVQHRAVRAALWVLVGVNVFLLAVATMRPAQHVISLFEAIYDRANGPITVFYDKKDPWDLSKTLPVDFYRPAGLTIEELGSDQEIRARALPEFRLMMPFFDPPERLASLGITCEPEFRTLPDWIRKLDFNGWVGRSGIWTLFECRAGPVARTP